VGNSTLTGACFGPLNLLLAPHKAAEEVVLVWVSEDSSLAIGPVFVLRWMRAF
jgi:hypothetical protein